jgi:uncharacterized membrane protein YbaN (DUF454 family)
VAAPAAALPHRGAAYNSPTRSPSAPGHDEQRSMTDDLPETVTTTGFVRGFLLGVGLLFAALGILGAFLPLLPTTPFMLVAAACFVRSSPAFHRRLLSNRVLGPYITQWQHDHTVPREAKRKAYVLVVVTFGLSIALVDLTWVRVTLAVLAVALVVLLACLPTTRTDGALEPSDRDR